MQQKEKKKQNFKITYQNDETVNNLRQSISQRSPDNKQMQFSIENAHLAKRNRLHYRSKDLQKIIFRYKVKKIVTNFIRKLRMNSIHRPPTQQHDCNTIKNQNQITFLQSIKFLLQKLSQKQGLSLGNIGLIIWSIINIIQITIMVFIFCIMMAFPETTKLQVFLLFRSISIVLYVIDMILNFSVKIYKSGKHLQKLGQISSDYLKHGFIADFISIVIFPIDILVQTQNSITILISFVALIKLFNNIKKFQKFQYLLIHNFQKEHYFGLIKVILTNFAIGHILSILLNLMAGMDNTINWHIKAGINHQQWYIKYIWGYYWGTNIMLTVGFGDICASNYYQAIVLVFIQTFSCITLAYNINYVGALISSIRQSQQQKKRKLKIFHRMCEQNFVQNTLQSKIANFMQQQFRIKQSFQYDVHDQVLKSLPKVMEKQFRKQANKTLFDNIGFLNNLSKKTLLNIAEVVSRRICHPEEIVLQKGAVFTFMILQKGSLSFTCRIRSKLDGNQIQTIDIKDGEKPKILSLNFIKNKPINFNVKSKGYSVLYELSRQEIMQTLKISEMDYQMICQLKDKFQTSLEQNNLYPCTICKEEFHNKFQCSRLHFVPIRMKVQMKHIAKDNKFKQLRFQHFQRSKNQISACLIYSQMKIDQKRFIQDNFDEEQFKQIQNLFQFYNNNGAQLGLGEKSTKSLYSQVQSTKKYRLIYDKALGRIQQILEARQTPNCDIWELDLDVAENFNFYFREGNPQELKKNKKTKRNKNTFYYLPKY